ncbi:tetratricopeptide repeat protein [Tenggerimyces flavus]|uniref:hypothetical protein n=1 Tax=Tenggerimyces flavus TaxID=1708749 RepID=UPI0036D8E038
MAKHLVAAAEFLEEDPERALAHANAARKHGARLAVVRETIGYAAYAAGNYEQALGELRAARRLNGSNEYLPVLADCERGLGRPERALELASSKEGKTLDKAGQIELRIVEAGARRDLGEPEAALRALTIPDLESKSTAEWVARLRYTYADTLESLGRTEEAAAWFARAAVADEDDLTDAADRHAALTTTTPAPESVDDVADPASAASSADDTIADDRTDVADDGAAEGSPAASTSAGAEAESIDKADAVDDGDGADDASTDEQDRAVPPIALFSHPDPDPLRPDAESS